MRNIMEYLYIFIFIQYPYVCFFQTLQRLTFLRLNPMVPWGFSFSRCLCTRFTRSRWCFTTQANNSSNYNACIYYLYIGYAPHICTYIYIHIYNVYIYIHTYIYTYVYIYIHVYAFVH